MLWITALISLSCSTNPYLCSNSLSLLDYPSCQYGCQQFCNHCTLMIEKGDKQNTSNTLLIVGVWKYNVVCITAPISVLLPIPIFALTHCLSTHPANMGVNGFCNLCMPTIEERDKQNTSNTLLIVGVWNCNVLCITAPISVLLYQSPTLV